MSNDLQKIDFHGDEISAYQDEETGIVYANVHKMCGAIGVSFATQSEKLRKDPVYANALNHFDIETIQGKRESLFLERKFIPQVVRFNIYSKGKT